MLFNTYDPWKFAFSKDLDEISNTEKGSFAIIGAPFDSTTSYHSGARLGPLVVREASYGFEKFNTTFNRNLDISFYDFGDSNIIPGNCFESIKLVESNVKELMEYELKPLIIGGEHSVSLGAIGPLIKQYGNLTVVHLDAHRDLADNFMGEKYSHATVMKRTYDWGIDELIQIGIRSSSLEEEIFADENSNIVTFKNNEVKFHMDNILYYLSQIQTPIYLSIDMDVLDPSVAPNVGNPTPDGITIHDVEDIIECLSLKNVVGLDVVETATPKLGDVTAVSAAKLIYDFLTLI